MIDVPEEVNCPFCDYLAGRRPYTVVVRGTLTATLVTREQRGRVHLLVVTVRHVPTILEVSDKEAAALMVAVRDAAWAITRVDVSDGISVWQNNGISAAQAIGHVHFHVAGTLPEGGTDFGEVPEISVAATDVIGSKVERWLSMRAAP